MYVDIIVGDRCGSGCGLGMTDNCSAVIVVYGLMHCYLRRSGVTMLVCVCRPARNVIVHATYAV